MKLKLIFLISSFLLVSACSITSTKTENDIGGIFVSGNNGETWSNRNAMPTAKGVKSLSNLNANVITSDPIDANGVYFGSKSNGLFYSYDNTAEWKLAKNLGKVSIFAIAIDPKYNCNIYVSTGNELWKSNDCTRNWEKIYHDTDEKTKINNIEIDHYDINIIFIGTSRGEVIRSEDKGQNWKTVGRFDTDITDMAISPHDSRIIFVGTRRDGVFRSYDSGEEWESIEDYLKESDKSFKKIKKIEKVFMANSDEGLVYFSSDDNLLRSWDFGDSWEKVNLITPDKKTTINDITVNPNDGNELYYITNTTFYRSMDGGETWATKKLNTKRYGAKVTVNNQKPNIIYMGVFKPEKKY